MNYWADILIVLLIAAAGIAGYSYGLIRQAPIAIGLLSGLFVTAFVYGRLAFLVQTSSTRTIMLVALMLAIMFLFFDVFLYLGSWLRARFGAMKALAAADKIAGLFAAMASSFVALWLMYVMFMGVLPAPALAGLGNSRLLAVADKTFYAPAIIRDVSRLSGPFKAPDVFVGDEPDFGGAGDRSNSADLTGAVSRVNPAMVKVNVWGCGTHTAGSGFLVSSKLIVTNAHVVAGAERLSLQNGDISLVGAVVWFDPSLDVAVIKTELPLAAQPLNLRSKSLAAGSNAAIVGYPGGGKLASGNVRVMQLLDADGYDIYGKSRIIRNIYALRGSVVPGNSGGPLVASDGQVAGLVFGHSSVDPKTGYAVASNQVANAIRTVSDSSVSVGVGDCTN